MEKPDNKETDTFSFFRKKLLTTVFWNLVYSQKKTLCGTSRMLHGAEDVRADPKCGN